MSKLAVAPVTNFAAALRRAHFVQLILVFVAALFGCSEPLTPPATVKTPVDKVSPSILDANHGGNPHFYFLPPMITGGAQATGISDPDQAPTVMVCEWNADNGGSCGAIVSQFGRGDGSSATDITYDATQGRYQVNWKTDQCTDGPCTLDVAKTYRLRVLIGAYEIGHADLDVVSNGSQLKNVQTGEYIGLVDGRTLPVKFRIEKGAVSVVTPGTPATVGAQGGVIASEDGSVSLDIPAGALTSDQAITVNPVTQQLVGVGEWAAPVDLGPSGTTFAQPVTLTLSYDASKLPAGLPASSLTIYTWAGDSWVPVPGSTVNEIDNTVSAPISHFSYYYVSARVTYDPADPTAYTDETLAYVGQSFTFTAGVEGYDIRPATYCYQVRVRRRILFWYFWTYQTQCVTVPSEYRYQPAGIRVNWFTSQQTHMEWVSSWTLTNTTLPGGTVIWGYYPNDASKPVYPSITNTAFDSPGYSITGTNGVTISPRVRMLGPGIASYWVQIGIQAVPVKTNWVLTRPVGSMRANPKIVTLSLTGPQRVKQLGVTVLDQNGVEMADQPAVWYNWNPELFAVDRWSGVVTAGALGTGRIMVRVGRFTDTLTVNVVQDLVASVSVTPGFATISPTSPGNSQQLTATLKDSGGNLLTGRAIAWESSDPSVASVDGSGLVTAVGPGTATITASSEGQTGTATINVRAPGYRVVYQGGDPTTLITQLIVQNTDGSNRHVLTSWTQSQGTIGSLAHWAPNGSTIAFDLAQPQWGAIYLINENQVNVDPTTLTRLMDNSSLNAGAEFSPDGKKILFLSTRTGQYELWIMDANGANQMRLLQSPSFDSPGGFSPDGSQIAFTRGTGNGSDVFVASFHDNGDGTYAVGTPRQVTAIGGNMSNVRWSPDGTRLVVSREDRLYVIDPTLDHASLSQIPPVNIPGMVYGQGDPDWSPDGKKIIFTSRNEWELYLVNPDGTGLEKIPTPANLQKGFGSFDPIP